MALSLFFKFYAVNIIGGYWEQGYPRVFLTDYFLSFLPSKRHYLVIDRRSEPRTGERVPYVVVYGTPGQPLIQLVKRPEDLLDNPGLRLKFNGVNYITKQLVPALDRCFSLLGVDVRQW